MKILVEFDVGCVVWPDISVRSAGEALLLDCYYCYDRGIANVAGLAVNDISVGKATWTNLDSNTFKGLIPSFTSCTTSQGTNMISVTKIDNFSKSR